MKHININIGQNDSTGWIIADTSAPADYDGFGTFCILEYEDREQAAFTGIMRTVLIREEHYGWQVARYESGNHLIREPLCEEAAVAEALWNRLRKVTS